MSFHKIIPFILKMKRKGKDIDDYLLPQKTFLKKSQKPYESISYTVYHIFIFKL